MSASYAIANEIARESKSFSDSEFIRSALMKSLRLCAQINCKNSKRSVYQGR